MYGLSNQVINDLCSIFEKYPEIAQVIIYGSRAKGNFKKGSDIDLTFCGENLTLQIISQIENEIENLYLPYCIDTSIYHNIDNNNLLAHISRIGKIFHQNKPK